MALMPETVYTRRIAMVEDYGFSAADVPVDGFTSEYLEVVWDGDPATIRTTLRHGIYWADNERPKVRYYWPDRDRQRAAEAMEGDYRETVGADAYAEVQRLNAVRANRSE